VPLQRAQSRCSRKDFVPDEITIGPGATRIVQAVNRQLTQLRLSHRQIVFPGRSIFSALAEWTPRSERARANRSPEFNAYLKASPARRTKRATSWQRSRESFVDEEGKNREVSLMVDRPFSGELHQLVGLRQLALAGPPMCGGGYAPTKGVSLDYSGAAPQQIRA